MGKRKGREEDVKRRGGGLAGKDEGKEELVKGEKGEKRRKEEIS